MNFAAELCAELSAWSPGSVCWDYPAVNICSAGSGVFDTKEVLGSFPPIRAVFVQLLTLTEGFPSLPGGCEDVNSE